MLVGFGSDLGRQQLVKEVGVGDLLLGRLLQARSQFVLDLIKPQLVAVLAQTFELRSAHRGAPPWLWLIAS